MECPNCGRTLPPLARVLAQTREGTQCPQCWARLRRLTPPVLVVSRRERVLRSEPRRRAA